MISERQSNAEGIHASSQGQGLDPDSLAAIRSVLDEDQDPGAGVAAEPPEKAMAKKPMDRLKAAASGLEDQDTAPRSASALDAVKAQILGYRPTAKHITLGVLVLLLLFRPWILFWTVVFGVFALIGLFLMFGYDGFWHRVMNIGRWYAKRNPARAVELNRKLDAFAMQWDMFLDHFPDGTVDGLYMPDFSEMATAESRHDEALDRRFANLHES